MRGKLAGAVLAVGLFAAAGCGADDGGGGGGGTEEVCEDVNQVVDPLETELTSALQAAGTAAAIEDEAALAEATIELESVIGEITGVLRDAAERADDDAFADSLRSFATEMENMSQTVLEGEQPDLTALGAAGEQVQGYCGTE